MSTDAGTFVRPQAVRSFIGYLPPAEALNHLSGRNPNPPNAAELQTRAETARDSVRTRVRKVDLSAVISPLPPVVDEYVTRLRTEPAHAPYFAEGYEVKMVDLTRVVAAQPSINITSACERVGAVETDDWGRLAEITLPIPGPPQALAATFDQTHLAWMLQSANPNLRIVGGGTAQTAPSVFLYGFLVQELTSVMSVAHYEGRYILRDGYHRAYGLLCTGVTSVPAYVRDFERYADILPLTGMLPHEVISGDNPPLLPDYLDPEFGIDVYLPTQRKLVVINGLELAPPA